MKKQVIEGVGILLLAIVLMGAGYLAGTKRKPIELISKKDIEQAKQKAVDSLQSLEYKQQLEQSELEKSQLKKEIQSLSKSNKKTKKDINDTDKKIKSIADIDVQRYVDSLRASAGFH